VGHLTATGRRVASGSSTCAAPGMAQALGLTILPSLLFQATDVIR
jgi:hypothetical protein